MRVNITARHYKAPDKLKEYAEKEVRKLTKYFDGIIEFAREKSEDIYKGIDHAVDKIERQLKKYKEKLKDHSYSKADSFGEPFPLNSE